MAAPPGTLTVTTPTDREVVVTRVFDAPRHLVFDAWTKPEHLPRWLGRAADEMSVCEIDLRPGGTYRYVWKLDDGSELAISGEYREVVPPERLVATEVFDAPYFEVMGSGTLNTMTFEEQDGRTTTTITILYQSKEARDSALQTGMTDGMGEGFDRMAELLGELTRPAA